MHRILACTLVGLVAACGEAPTAEGCSSSVTPSAKEARFPHPRKPSSCGVLLMSANYCTYDSQGRFKAVEQEVIGVCLSTSTP